MIPAWVVPQQWRELEPPAEVRRLGDVRSAENLIAATLALHVKEAPRYTPTPAATWCNVFLRDVLAILKAPIPMRFDFGDGRGVVETRANDIATGLKNGVWPGWLPVSEASAAFGASQGLPTVAVWRNPTGRAGHVVIVVPTPAGKSGVYVTGAGRQCLESCPIAQAFGPYVRQVEFYGHL